MNAIEVALNRFNSWNRHDAEAFVATYAEGGTYRSPRADHDLTGQAIGELVKSFWTAFPDGSLELISIGDTGGGLVASQWVLYGTHTGPYLEIRKCRSSERTDSSPRSPASTPKPPLMTNSRSEPGCGTSF